MRKPLYARFLNSFILSALLSFGLSPAYAQSSEDNFITLTELPASLLDNKLVDQVARLKSQNNTKAVHWVKFGDLPKLQKKGKLKFSLPGKEGKIEAVTFRVEKQDDLHYTWYATTPDGVGSIIVIRNGDSYTGHISLPDAEYQILSGSQGYQLLVEADAEIVKSSTCAVHSTTGKGRLPQPSGARIDPCQATPTRVLILFTPAAAATGLNMNDVANSSIAQFNSCIYRSAITSDAVIQLAGPPQQVAFNESFNIQNDANLLFGRFEGLRDANDADLVVLLTNSTTYGPAGAVAQGGLDVTSNTAFAIVQITQAPYKIFAHEVAHLFGCHHDNDPTGPAYAHGYEIQRPLAPNYRTIESSGGSGEPGLRIFLTLKFVLTVV